jgi:hypothetical protein
VNSEFPVASERATSLIGGVSMGVVVAIAKKTVSGSISI